MPVKRAPYYYLDGLLSILVVDDNPAVRALITTLLSQIPLFRLRTASTAVEAAEILSGIERTHLCIMDLGLTDCAGNQFHLLENYLHRCAFVVFTGNTSPAAGFEAHRHGAVAIIEKTAPFDTVFFLNTIFLHLLREVINPLRAEDQSGINRATEALFAHSPRYVAQWAQSLGMTDRALRFIWAKALGANAKIILYIYRIYMAALCHFEKTTVGAPAHFGHHHAQAESYVALEETFHLHRSVITDYLAFAPIAASGLSHL